jgi:hypothetical protein
MLIIFEAERLQVMERRGIISHWRGAAELASFCGLRTS